MISLILLLVAFALFVAAGFNVAAPRYSLVSFGLASWVLAVIISEWP